MGTDFVVRLAGPVHVDLLPAIERAAATRFGDSLPVLPPVDGELLLAGSFNQGGVLFTVIQQGVCRVVPA